MSLRTRPAHEVTSTLRRAGSSGAAIAKRLGVAHSAVSMTIHRTGAVAPKTREKIWRAIENAVENGGTR